MCGTFRKRIYSLTLLLLLHRLYKNCLSFEENIRNKNWERAQKHSRAPTKYYIEHFSMYIDLHNAKILTQHTFEHSILFIFPLLLQPHMQLFYEIFSKGWETKGILNFFNGFSPTLTLKRFASLLNLSEYLIIVLVKRYSKCILQSHAKIVN